MRQNFTGAAYYQFNATRAGQSGDHQLRAQEKDQSYDLIRRIPSSRARSRLKNLPHLRPFFTHVLAFQVEASGVDDKVIEAL